MSQIIYLVPTIGLLSLIYTLIKANWIKHQDAGNDKMQSISDKIAKGAIEFLKTEYKTVSIFVIGVSIILFYLSFKNEDSHPLIVVSFIFGAIFSALSGYIGMTIATKANVRTSAAAQNSLSKAFKVSFSGGIVMGMGVAGLAILGLSAFFIIFLKYFLPEGLNYQNRHNLTIAIETLTGFSLGAESVALFARVAGGIYTKAADVGADIVGKIESDIPEDDPRNPATIADNVGDNVGDVAGMGADLFGSYIATIVAAMFLGSEINTLGKDNFEGLSTVILPLVLGGMGLIFSLIGTMVVRVNSENSNVQTALNIGNWTATILSTIGSYFAIKYILPNELSIRGVEFTSIQLFYSVLTGLFVGMIITMITEYFTSLGKKPVNFIIEQSSTGHATNVIAGLSVGMMSTAFSIILFAIGIALSYYFANVYGVAIAAAGMMATTAIQLSIDAFGPIADNAGGISEMSGLPEEVRKRTDILDTVGNTTAATGKGFAIASAALTSLALFAAFVKAAKIDHIDIFKADVLSGLFVGAMIPFLFSALAISAVGKAAMDMVREVRRQFREIKGIMDGSEEPEYDKCISISTNAAIKEMILPGSLAILSPTIIGFAFGAEVLGGFLAGLTVSGVIMAVFQCNAGGAWDNAKKGFEKGVTINGKIEYKGSEAHKASVTGDTVGDPFKDTSGPSMNILIKLSTIVALVIAPLIADKTKIHNNSVKNNIEHLEQQHNHHHHDGRCSDHEH